MTVESDADRLHMLQDFGVSCTPSVAPRFTGILDLEYADALEMAGTSPALWCREKDVLLVEEGETIAVDDTDYIVKVKQPDGTGMAVLIMDLA